jgi:hypothetical protein
MGRNKMHDKDKKKTVGLRINPEERARVWTIADSLNSKPGSVLAHILEAALSNIDNAQLKDICKLFKRKRTKDLRNNKS